MIMSGSNSAQLAGIRFIMTDGTILLAGSILGVPTANINPSGPLVGMYGTLGTIVDGFGFYTDTCYCYRSVIQAWTLPNPWSVQLGQVGTPTATWINTGNVGGTNVQHLLGRIWSQDPCIIAFKQTNTPAIMTTANQVITVTTADPLKVN
jgi:hypothetical protein